MADATEQLLLAQQIALSNAVGECLMAWAHVEFRLHEMFVRQVVHQSRNRNRWTVARSIWSTVISFEARLKMTNAAINANIEHEKTKADWGLLNKYTASMSSLRNEIAHGAAMNRDNKEMMIQPLRHGYSVARPDYDH